MLFDELIYSNRCPNLKEKNIILVEPELPRPASCYQARVMGPALRPNVCSRIMAVKELWAWVCFEDWVPDDTNYSNESDDSDDSDGSDYSDIPTL